MAYRDDQIRRTQDRARFHKRVAVRREHGQCIRCGKQAPEQGRSVCAPCAEKRRVAERARNARLKAAGKPRRDLEKARAYERTRARRRTAERVAQGLCTKCGRNPPEPGRRMCEPCAVKRRKAERERYGRAKAEGKPYGGRDAEVKRKAGRERSRKRRLQLLAAGLCTRCGKHPCAGGGTVCEDCRTIRRAAGRKRYAARRAEGLCGKCGQPAFSGASQCAVCAATSPSRDREKKNAASRKRYARRRALNLCTDCGAPSQGAARCPECARHSYLRSGMHRGLPLYPPTYTVIELATGARHGTWDSPEEVAMCLGFARLSREEVEIVVDSSPLQAMAGR